MTWSHLRREPSEPIIIPSKHEFTIASLLRKSCKSFFARNRFSSQRVCDVFSSPIHCAVFCSSSLRQHYHKIFILTRDEPERTNIDVNVSKSHKFVVCSGGRDKKWERKLCRLLCRRKLFSIGEGREREREILLGQVLGWRWEIKENQIKMKVRRRFWQTKCHVRVDGTNF